MNDTQSEATHTEAQNGRHDGLIRRLADEFRVSLILLGIVIVIAVLMAFFGSSVSRIGGWLFIAALVLSTLLAGVLWPQSRYAVFLLYERGFGYGFKPGQGLASCLVVLLVGTYFVNVARTGEVNPFISAERLETDRYYCGFEDDGCPEPDPTEGISARETRSSGVALMRYQHGEPSLRSIAGASDTTDRTEQGVRVPSVRKAADVSAAGTSDAVRRSRKERPIEDHPPEPDPPPVCPDPPEPDCSACEQERHCPEPEPCPECEEQRAETIDRELRPDIVLVLDPGYALAQREEYDPAKNREERSVLTSRPTPCNTGMSSFVYAADLFLPLVEFEQARRCSIREVEGEGHDPYIIWRWAAAFYQLLGWVMISLLLLSATRVLQRDLET